MHARPCSRSRSGTILIIVAGVSSLLASLSLLFLARMRSDMEESALLMQEGQAHIMLVAACNYIQEASRLGYDGPPKRADDTYEPSANYSSYHREGFGWIDVRDGTRGPKATNDSSNPTVAPGIPHPFVYGVHGDDNSFPIMTARRFDMYVKNVPPFAIRLDAAPNPIRPIENQGIPYLLNPDPMPVLAPQNFASPTDTEFKAFERGNPDPRMNSTGRAWFRLFRLGARDPADPRYDARFARYNAATFIVTCGAGGSRGFKDWQEVVDEESDDLFAGDQGLFAQIQQNEIRLWYLVEWSPAVGGQMFFNSIHHRDWTWDANNDAFSITQYGVFPMNHTHYTHSQARPYNYGGTIRLIQRLVIEPEKW